MTTTDNEICRRLAMIMSEHGVGNVVLSPGTRNAPIITAIKALGRFKVRVVADERSAAFVALGICQTVKQPVAIVCTSGTAIYNYAPALAEAYYRKLPLVAITADRPAAWIGQNDSQTLRQPGALDNILKKSFNLRCGDSAENLWYATRQINEALLLATAPAAGPVHLNVELGEPLNGLVDLDPGSEHFPVVREIFPEPSMSVGRMRELSRGLASPRRVMVVVGFMSPDSVMRKAIVRLAQFPNIVVVSESVSNLGGVGGVVANIDATLATIPVESRPDFAPDVVVSVGGALVSRNLKAFLRRFRPEACWNVGYERDLVDCFQSLSLQVTANPALFMRGLASAMQIHRSPSGYAALWRERSETAMRLTNDFARSAPWCDLKLFAEILPRIPGQWNLEISNGTSIRYSQLFPSLKAHSVSCNRGVSGIDGSTSTALGASTAYLKAPTLLITGDMSATYDIGALFTNLLTPRFKMLVIDNGGGGIFRFIKSTSNLPDVDECFATNLSTPFAEVARSLGFECYDVDDEASLKAAWPKFMALADRPAMIVAHTDGELSASVLRSYFDYLKRT